MSRRVLVAGLPLLSLTGGLGLLLLAVGWNSVGTALIVSCLQMVLPLAMFTVLDGSATNRDRRWSA